MLENLTERARRTLSFARYESRGCVRAVAAVVLIAFVPMGTAAVATEPTAPVIAEVKVVGGSTITADTVEYYLGASKGDPYEPKEIAKNFHRFWDSGLVEDLKVETEELAPGKVRLIVTVKERPKVTEFIFSGNKKLSTSTIKEKLDTANVTLKRDVPLHASDLQRFKQAITEVYAKEGYASAIVDPRITDAGPNAKKVTFHIDEGAKIKIGKVRFEGNKVFSDRRLRGALKKTKQKSLFRLFGKTLIWSKESWGEDSENLKKFYMNHGFKDIVVGEPKVDMIARNPAGKTQIEKKFRMIITIPVQEGKQFRMGELFIKGDTVFPPDALRKLYEIKSGKTYNYATVENGNEAVRNLYQGRGYINAYTNQVLVERKNRPDTVDVSVNVYEGDRFRLGRIEFSGNTKTQDKVLRREFRLIEGTWMNMPLFKRSLFKVKQLGYFKLKDDPVEFKFDDENKRVNVLLKGEEVGRTNLQFGAGYSEVEHLFAQISFNTHNFLGRGEIFGISLQSGSQASAYSLSFSEPYFLDKRMLVGASIYKQKIDITTYIRNSKGGSLIWGDALGDFDQFSIGYGYDDVNAQYVIARDILAGGGDNQHRQPLPPPYKDISGEPYYYQPYAGITSSLMPGYSFDSRDDPFDPNSGVSMFGRVRYAGGLLGGDFHYWRPEAGFSWFHPLTRKTIFATNLEGGIMVPFRGVELPVYDRYRLGGERSLRAFDYLSVLPRKANGEEFLDAYGVPLGGDRYLQLNLEYQIKLGGPLRLVFFSDIGNTWNESQGWDLSLIRRCVGAEFRVFLPMFQAPLRFIYGINLKPYPAVTSQDLPAESRGNFQFSIGSTF